MQKRNREPRLPVLAFQKVDVLVSCGAADVADSRQFGHIELSLLVGGIVAKESRRNIIGGHLRSADLLSFCLCFLHAGADSRPNHGQFRLTEHGSIPQSKIK